MRSSGITVVTTTVGPPRRAMLRRALESVWAQTLQPDQVIVSQDNAHRGAPFARQAGTEGVRTPYVAYLDDDDEFRPHHLAALHARAVATEADLVFPWFDVVGGGDPFPHYEGAEWDNDAPRQVPVTFLARTDAIRAAGGWTYVDVIGTDPGTDADGNRAGEDYQLILRMCASGAKIVHLPERTWVWHHHGGNYMGLPSRVPWDTVG